MNNKNSPLDRFAVAYLKDGAETWLQTEYSQEKADRAAGIVNEHEARNGRPEKFYVIPIA